MKDNKKELLPVINEQIRFPRMQVIDTTGENLGAMSREEALHKAMERQLDLVLLTAEGNTGVPVVKIMDFGKVLYERKKKKAEAKKHQKIIQVKEIKVRPKIGEHDYQTKMKQAVQFLKEGKRVKVTLCFRGRENMNRDELGNELFSKIEHTFDVSGLIKNMGHENDVMQGQMWSRTYFLKTTK